MVKKNEFESERDFIESLEHDIKNVVKRTLSRCRTLKKKKEPWLTQYQILGEYFYTRKQNFLDEHTGSLEVGKQADIVVLDQNLFEIPTQDISDTRILLTLLEGEVMYGSLEDF